MSAAEWPPGPPPEAPSLRWFAHASPLVHAAYEKKATVRWPGAMLNAKGGRHPVAQGGRRIVRQRTQKSVVPAQPFDKPLRVWPKTATCPFANRIERPVLQFASATSTRSFKSVFAEEFGTPRDTSCTVPTSMTRGAPGGRKGEFCSDILISLPMLLLNGCLFDETFIRELWWFAHVSPLVHAVIGCFAKRLAHIRRHWGVIEHE